jgi:hypothetical protein
MLIGRRLPHSDNSVSQALDGSSKALAGLSGRQTLKRGPIANR